mmetsp:Transcript_86242/g.244674  ORF Transcript_86242/g.244674 Transcript_86242/m.244674 type:complete len:166 (-) Transcript_86242:242-739(-)
MIDELLPLAQQRATVQARALQTTEPAPGRLVKFTGQTRLLQWTGASVVVVVVVVSQHSSRVQAWRLAHASELAPGLRRCVLGQSCLSHVSEVVVVLLSVRVVVDVVEVVFVNVVVVDIVVSVDVLAVDVVIVVVVVVGPVKELQHTHLWVSVQFAGTAPGGWALK